MSDKARAEALDESHSRIVVAHGPKRYIYIGMGLLFVGLAGVGTVLPGLPTTPFILLASFFFVRSSPRLEAWLLRNKVFGPLLLDWKVHRGIRPSVKVVSIVIVLVTLTLTLTLGSLSKVLQYAVGGLGLIGLVVIARLPTIPQGKALPRMESHEEP